MSRRGLTLPVGCRSITRTFIRGCHRQRACRRRRACRRQRACRRHRDFRSRRDTQQTGSRSLPVRRRRSRWCNAIGCRSPGRSAGSRRRRTRFTARATSIRTPIRGPPTAGPILTSAAPPGRSPPQRHRSIPPRPRRVAGVSRDFLEGCSGPTIKPRTTRPRSRITVR